MSWANPEGHVWTIDLPSKSHSETPDLGLIGHHYRNSGSSNVTQIVESSLTFDPKSFNIPFCDLVLVDGCHDYEYVVNDCVKALTFIRPGGCLILDDFVLPGPEGPNKYVHEHLERNWFQINGTKLIYTEI